MGNQKGKVLEISSRSRKFRRWYSSGEVARFSGLYRLQHQEHAINKEILVIKGTTLPFCPVCGKAIEFHLVQKVDHIADDPDFKIVTGQE